MSTRNEKYITIYEWMNDLDLSPVEKIAYALVYSFCKKGECFSGKNSYLQEWLGCTKKTAITTMASLEEKGLVVREQQMVNGKQTNVYTMGEKITPKGCKNYTVGVQKLHQGGVKITPNNNNDINIDNISSTTTHAREINQIINWMVDNADGTQMLLKRNGVISRPVDQEEMRCILLPLVTEYFNGELEAGKGNIDQRGRLDILGHFRLWLPKYISRKNAEQEREEIKFKPLKPKANELTREEFLAALD